MGTAVKLFTLLLEGLTDRQKQVLSARFGLNKSANAETLAAIGERMGVTRERIRQIEASGLAVVNKKLASAGVQALLDKAKKHLKANGGVLRKELLLGELERSFDGLGENHLALLIAASGSIGFYAEDKDFWPFYYLSKNDLANATKFVDTWTNYLDTHKEDVFAESYDAVFEEFLKSEKTTKPFAEAYLAISKKIHENPYGDKGHRDWAEIRPETIRDQVYLVLKKTAEPLHFETITKEINKVGFGRQTALAPTVHNELIKDSRFVLVGRGIYALREHGYEPGTAREVIARILKVQGPLSAKEVITSVNKERFFKPNTVLINLQNKKFFERMPDGRYTVREA